MAARPWRMRLPTALPLLLGLWALASPAGAQVYRWVDPDGSIHYSDSPSSAPKDAKVEVTTGDDITVEGTGRIEAGTPPTNPPLPQTPPPRTNGASGDWSGPPTSDQPSEQVVRQSFRDTHQKIADAEKQLAQAKKVVEAQERGMSTTCNGTREDCTNWRRQLRANQDAARERVTELEAELRKWKSYLDDLERWASSKAVPRAWRE